MAIEKVYLVVQTDDPSRETITAIRRTLNGANRAAERHFQTRIVYYQALKQKLDVSRHSFQPEGGFEGLLEWWDNYDERSETVCVKQVQMEEDDDEDDDYYGHPVERLRQEQYIILDGLRVLGNDDVDVEFAKEIKIEEIPRRLPRDMPVSGIFSGMKFLELVKYIEDTKCDELRWAITRHGGSWYKGATIGFTEERNPRYAIIGNNISEEVASWLACYDVSKLHYEQVLGLIGRYNAKAAIVKALETYIGGEDFGHLHLSAALANDFAIPSADLLNVLSGLSVSVTGWQHQFPKETSLLTAFGCSIVSLEASAQRLHPSITRREQEGCKLLDKV